MCVVSSGLLCPLVDKVCLSSLTTFSHAINIKIYSIPSPPRGQVNTKRACLEVDWVLWFNLG